MERCLRRFTHTRMTTPITTITGMITGMAAIIITGMMQRRWISAGALRA